ncbi:glutathione-disulfide reductase [Candidatus Uabimicrobium sp. HlEnr_7]|uniref:glutathione-disulfide reductase n=1 Tax=Candidatus Uabimicrobium helgolandensis TaxID=3095367 RepID=UPI0035575D16
MSFDYDYVVIGGGSGGIASARRAASYGAKVALIEGHRLGGTCVNVGCVPKKMMHIAALLGESLEYAQHFGWDVKYGGFDWKFFKEKRDTDIVRLNGIYEKNLRNSNITIIEGWAKFVDSHTIDVNGQKISGKYVLIASGGKPNSLNIPGIEHTINSDGFFALEECPKKAIVVGAGYIAIELAGILNALGSEVTLVARGDKLLKNFDREIIEHLENYLQQEGIKILFSSNVNKVEKTETSLDVTISNNGNEELQQADCVLLAVGRNPNVEPLQLENTQVKQGKRKEIIAGEDDTTADPAIYAIGDVVGKLELTPVAIKCGRLLADRLFAQKSKLMNYSAVPTAIFSPLEIGTCGISEEEAVEKYGQDNIKVYRARFTPMVHTITKKQAKMVMKMIVEKEGEKVLGMHLIGPDSAEIIQGFGIAVRLGLSKADLDDVVALHPSAAEEFVTMT